MPEGSRGAMGEGEKPPTLNMGVLWDGSSATDYLENYIQNLKRRVGVKAAVLIGSRARGGWRPHSDIDLLLVVEGDKSRISVGIVDPRPYTWRELLEAIEGCEVEVIEAFEDGIILFDDGSWREARKLYLKVKRRYGVKRYKDGWMVERRPTR